MLDRGSVLVFLFADRLVVLWSEGVNEIEEGVVVLLAIEKMVAINFLELEGFLVAAVRWVLLVLVGASLIIEF